MRVLLAKPKAGSTLETGKHSPFIPTPSPIAPSSHVCTSHGGRREVAGRGAEGRARTHDNGTIRGLRGVTEAKEPKS